MKDKKYILESVSADTVIAQVASPEYYDYHYESVEDSLNGEIGQISDKPQIVIENEVEESFKHALEFVKCTLEFDIKFWLMHWDANSDCMHKHIDEFRDEFEDFIDEVAEEIMGVWSVNIKKSEYQNLAISQDENPLNVLYQLKVLVSDYLKILEKAEEKEFEGIKSTLTAFMATIDKYMYLFRLCK